LRVYARGFARASGIGEREGDVEMRPEIVALVRELMTGLISEDEFVRRANALGATDAELEEAMS
jgi:hypothetical protein